MVSVSCVCLASSDVGRAPVECTPAAAMFAILSVFQVSMPVYEDSVRHTQGRPQALAAYAVSDPNAHHYKHCDTSLMDKGKYQACVAKEDRDAARLALHPQA